MSADLLARLDQLDQLDQAHAAATMAMPWRQDSGWGEDIITADGEQFGATGHPADTALIVAAVNALPKLTAALRAVLAKCDRADVLAEYRPGLVITDTLRAAITAALTPESVPS